MAVFWPAWQLSDEISLLLAPTSWHRRVSSGGERAATWLSFARRR